MDNSMQLEHHNMCYACGKKNEKGLHLAFSFFEKEKRIETTFIPSSFHQGLEGIVHGGIIVTIMDEAMAKLINSMGYVALTASLDIRFRDMAKTLEPLTISAEVTKFAKKLIFAKAVANGGDGKVIAEADAKLIIY